ncbi:MAG: hypothetical protein [Myoviridae sp. ctThM1]|nr:MAG: hypothetical protein [Myoviridae sp. ctThM1]
MTLVLIVWLVNTILPGLSCVLALTFIGLLIAIVITGLYALIEEESEPLLKILSYKKSLFALVILSILIPSKETTWYMVGAYGTQKLVESPAAQELASDGVDVLKELLAKAKRELAEDKPKESAK